MADAKSLLSEGPAQLQIAVREVDPPRRQAKVVAPKEPVEAVEPALLWGCEAQAQALREARVHGADGEDPQSGHGRWG